MNKAFVREADEPDPRCPRCGGLGQSVGRATVAAHLPPEAAARLSENAFYCPNPRCAAAYFDASGLDIGVEQMRGSAYPKDPNGPICPCLGVKAEPIEREALAGQKDRVRALLAKANAPDAQCLTKAPNGRPCADEVQQLFLRCFNKPGAPGSGAAPGGSAALNENKP